MVRFLNFILKKNLHYLYYEKQKKLVMSGQLQESKKRLTELRREAMVLDKELGHTRTGRRPYNSGSTDYWEEEVARLKARLKARQSTATSTALAAFTGPSVVTTTVTAVAPPTSVVASTRVDPTPVISSEAFEFDVTNLRAVSRDKLLDIAVELGWQEKKKDRTNKHLTKAILSKFITDERTRRQASTPVTELKSDVKEHEEEVQVHSTINTTAPQPTPVTVQRVIGPSAEQRGNQARDLIEQLNREVANDAANAMARFNARDQGQRKKRRRLSSNVEEKEVKLDETKQEPEEPLALQLIIDQEMLEQPANVHGSLRHAAQQIVGRAQRPLIAGHQMTVRFHFRYDNRLTTMRTLASQITQLVVDNILPIFKFDLQIFAFGRIINTRTGEYKDDIRASFRLRDNHTFDMLRERGDAQKIIEAFGQFLETVPSNEKLYPSTEWKFQCIRSLQFDIFKVQAGGCANHPILQDKYPGLFNKRQIHNSGDKDNLCFWRCLAMALDPGCYDTKGKKQRIKAQELQQRAKEALANELTVTDVVALTDIDKIGKALELDIHVYTRRAGTSESIKLLGDEHFVDEENSICLYFDEQGAGSKLGHYVLISSVTSYCKILKCPICGEPFEGSNKPRDFTENHMRKHRRAHPHISQPTEPKFKSGCVSTKRYSPFEMHLKEPLQHDVYIGFDFECLLPRINEETVENEVKTETIISHHVPVGVVAKIRINGEEMKDDDTKFKEKHLCHCRESGLGAAKKFVKWLEDMQEPLKEFKEKNFWRKYQQKMNKLEAKICTCVGEPVFKHAGYCNHYANQIQNKDTDEPCCCEPHKQHNGGCAFKEARTNILGEVYRTPVIGYNSGKYDMTFVVSALAHSKLSKGPNGEVTMETINRGNNYLSLNVGIYNFIDAHNFVPPNVNLAKFATMWKVKNIQKELFPYDWFQKVEQLDEKELPPRECFFNEMVKEHATEAEYEEAKAIWKRLGFKRFSEYMMYYCECDVELLMQGVSNFRSMFLHEYEIDVLNFMSIPQIANGAFMNRFLKHEHDLHYIPNQQTFDIINPSIYGGNCQVFKRYAKCKDNTELIVALDENSMYAHSASQLLPYGGLNYASIDTAEGRARCKAVFKSLSEVSRDSNLHKGYSEKTLHNKERNGDGTMKVPEDPYKFTGFAMVHLSYTSAQKQKVRHFVPLPNKRIVKEEEYSEFMKQLLGTIEQATQSKKTMSEKLVYDLYDKNMYCIYSEALKFLLENDMVTLNAVYAVVEMQVGYVMRSFVDELYINRQKAEDDINRARKALNANGQLLPDDQRLAMQELLCDASARKEFYKLMSNSAYGKMMQSDEKFTDTKFLGSMHDRTKLLMGGRVPIQSVPLSAHLVEVRCKKENPVIKAPKYIGSAILWNSKMLMWDFVYNCLWKYSPNAEIMYTDTDSLYILLRGLPPLKSPEARFDAWMQRFPQEMQERHFSKPGDITVGKMKLEKLIEEAVFLKPKTYSYRKFGELKREEEIKTNELLYDSIDMLIEIMNKEEKGRN